jgi:hypothetical protein
MGPPKIEADVFHDGMVNNLRIVHFTPQSPGGHMFGFAVTIFHRVTERIP